MKASSEQLKQWRKLKMGKYRKREGLFLAEGIRTVEQILKNGCIKTNALIYSESISGSDLPECGLPLYEVSNDEMKSLSDTETPQGVIAICETPAESDLNNLSASGKILLALDRIQDPGNLGTIIRTATWFGIGGVLFGSGCVDPFHPKVVRSTAGATGALPFIHGDLSELLQQFEELGHPVFLLDAGERSLRLDEETTAIENAILLIGNEANGIHTSLYSDRRKLIHIPGSGELAESLNASVAAAIVLYYFTK